jgi:hypothetical protein
LFWRKKCALRGGVAGLVVLALCALGAPERASAGPPLPTFSAADSLLRPDAMLTGPAGFTSAFGISIAVSGDGNTAVIGGASDDGGVGAVWVFVRSGSGWSQQGPKLIPAGPTASLRPPLAQNFGSVLGISADGNRLVIGDGRFGPLAAWVFVREHGVWRQQGSPLVPPHRTQESTSGSETVAVSGDGNTLAFAGSTSNFRTWVYVFSHGRWHEQGRPLQALGYLGLSFNGSVLLDGTSSYIRARSHWRRAANLRVPESEGPRYSGLALSADGATALAADRQHQRVLVFRRLGARWMRVAVLSSPDPQSQVVFAENVKLSADGRTALVAAVPRSTASGGEPVGYLFTLMAGAGWRNTGALKLYQPWSAALSGDGRTMVAAPFLREVGERIESSGGPAQVFVEASGAWREQATLAPSDATGVDSRTFGADFALSADASTALISETSQLAWVFTRSGETWSTQAPLSLQGTTEGGAHVALSADGNTAVLAGPSAPGPVAAWVFTRTNGAWSTHGMPLMATGAGPHPPGAPLESGGFASSVAISGDGNVILVGAEWDSGHTGAAWAFVRSGSGWVLQGKLTPTGPSAEERFGDSVALSADGSVALIGAVGDRQRPPDGSPPEGAAYVFTRVGSNWSQAAKLIDNEQSAYEPRRGLGVVVALSADRNTALIGAYDHALIFTQTPSGWQQHRPPLRPFGHESYATYGGRPAFGDVIALAANGNTALVSGIPKNGCGRYDEGPCSGSSIVWTFSRAGEAWVRQPLPLIDGLSLGKGLALSADGHTALIRGITPGPEPGGAVFAAALTPRPATSFVIEPPQVEYEGTLTLELWSPTHATFKAIARVTSPTGGLPCPTPRRSDRRRRAPRCRAGLTRYGQASSQGSENVALQILPTHTMRKYLRRHKHLRLAITITEQPSPPAPASTQTIPLPVSFVEAPSGV